MIRQHTAYSYDAFNRQTAVETFDGNIQINHYDAEGLRHEMEENGKLVQFIFRGTEVVVEETQEENIRYIRTHELLASDAESARTYYHYASDEMGSITHVTDEEGNILNRYEYDAWGNLTVEEEQVSNRFKYTGEQFDPITQQYYLRARFYNPALARFLQEDTYRGDGLNLYAYCANNPVRYVDPSGHWCEVKQNVYERLVRENGLDINNIDPETKLRLMAEASNIVDGRNVGRNDTVIELPGPIITGQNRLPGPVADTPDDGRRDDGGNGNTQTISNKFPNDNQAGKNFNYTIKDGKIYIENGIQEVDFVIDMNGNLSIGRGHSYLAKGQNVQAAGTMKVNSQGYIRNITNESGHFQPTVTEALNYPQIFKNSGLTIDNTWIKVSEFNTSMSNYVINSKVFYNGPIQYMPQ